MKLFPKFGFLQWRLYQPCNRPSVLSKNCEGSESQVYRLCGLLVLGKGIEHVDQASEILPKKKDRPSRESPVLFGKETVSEELFFLVVKSTQHIRLARHWQSTVASHDFVCELTQEYRGLRGVWFGRNSESSRALNQFDSLARILGGRAHSRFYALGSRKPRCWAGHGWVWT